MDPLLAHSPVFLIEVDKIVPNPDQPRREFNESALRDLANSIREVGLIQPIVVTKLEKETETGTAVQYQLIAGERRLMASKLIGLERIPAIIKKVDFERERLELALIENIQRANLNPIETARAFARFHDEFRMTQREVAVRVGKSRELIANTVRLLNLPTQIQEAVAQGRVSESQARLLLSVTDPANQQKLFEEIILKNLSVRELQSRINETKKRVDGETKAIEPNSVADPETAHFEKELEVALGTRVHVERSGQTGKITIAFFSPEELRGIVEKLTQPNTTEAGNLPPESPITI